MTPNIGKGFKDTAKFQPDVPDSVKAQANDAPSDTSTHFGKTDGDHAAKSMDSVATATAGAGTDLSDGLHETAKSGVSLPIHFSTNVVL
jgi:hypothetical protein